MFLYYYLYYFESKLKYSFAIWYKIESSKLLTCILDSNLKETANKEAFDKFEATQATKPVPVTVEDDGISSRYDCW